MQNLLIKKPSMEQKDTFKKASRCQVIGRLSIGVVAAQAAPSPSPTNINKGKPTANTQPVCQATIIALTACPRLMIS